MTDRHMHSPWRSQYIEGAKGEDAEGRCVFCTTPEEADAKRDEERLIVLRGQQAYVCMNLFPYNAGHLLINPYRHVSDLDELRDDEYQEIFGLLRVGQRLLRKALKPGGFNVGINLGAAAGAGIAGHLHVHLIPRWGGDTNFMPTAADIRVVSLGMQDVLARLQAAVREDQSG